MIQPKPELDIARNIKTIEWLRSEIVGGVSALFKAMIKNREEAILDALVNIIMNCYLLGRRLGLNFTHIDLKIEQRLKLNVEKNHEIEKWYGDLSALLQHMRDKNKE